MKHIILFIFVFLSIEITAKTITDMAGRNITIPEKIERILPYDAKTSILLFPVADEKMMAKAMLPGSKHDQFIAEEYNQMAQVDMKNLEVILVCNPQIIIVGAYISSHNYETFETLQKRLHIPVVVVDLSIDKLDDTYLFLGKLLDKESKCSRYVTFLQDLYTNTKELMIKNHVKNTGVYYTIGGSGLMTDPSGSKHTEVLDYLKLNNVTKVIIPTGGHAHVNMEQVIKWNPDYIFAAGFKGNKNAYSSIISDKKWQNISAVKNGKVYKVPSLPFGWFDHPPSVNRIPAIIWLSELFYKLPKEEAQKQIIKFYKLFYQYELSKEEYASLFK